ncbi:hypothetical protein BKA93DRAFT_217141 [Sparassis latifolia]
MILFSSRPCGIRSSVAFWSLGLLSHVRHITHRRLSSCHRSRFLHLRLSPASTRACTHEADLFDTYILPWPEAASAAFEIRCSIFGCPATTVLASASCVRSVPLVVVNCPAELDISIYGRGKSASVLVSLPGRARAECCPHPDYRSIYVRLRVHKLRSSVKALVLTCHSRDKP